MRRYSAQIVAGTAEQLRALDRFGLDLKHRAARRVEEGKYSIPAILSDVQIDQVKDAGYTVEAVIDLETTAVKRLKEIPAVNRFAETRSVLEHPQFGVQGYMTAEEVELSLSNMHTLHPDLITLIALPHQTWEGRICHAIRLKAGAKTGRPGVLFTGSMHAREWGGSDICINFAIGLVNAYRQHTPLVFGGKIFTAVQVQTILENLEVFVFPDVNPDGKNFSQHNDFWWRKNRNPNSSVDPGHPGVDLNRNFDFLWSSGIGTSTAASSEVYKGAAAFSEPETRNVRYLVEAYDNITYYVDIHSYSELILYSWGDDNNQNSDPSQNFQNSAYDGKRGTQNDTLYREFISTLDENTLKNYAKRMQLALAAVRGRQYTVQQSVGLYPTTGTSDDYTLSRHITDGLKNKVYGFTIEFGSEFVPPFAEMKEIIKDVGAAMTEFCWTAGSDVFFRDNPTDTGSVPSSAPFWDSQDIWVRNVEDGGTVHQDTIRGSDNFVYARVTNGGMAEARELTIRFYLASYAGTEFVHPYDWVPKNPAGGGGISGSGTYLIGETKVALLPAGASTIVSVKWPASLVPPAPNWHPCLLVEVSPNDGKPLSGRHVWQSNSLAQKNISIVTGQAGKSVLFPFRFGGSHNTCQAGEIVVKKVMAAKKMEIILDLQDDALLQHMGMGTATAPVPWSDRIVRGFKPVKIDGRTMFSLTGAISGRIYLPLKPGRPEDMALRIRVPDRALPGDRYQIHVIQYADRRKIAGGLTVEINIIA